jgi:hypothetical protein
MKSQGAQVSKGVAFQPAGVVEVELLQGLAGGESGGADAALAAVGLPCGDLALQAGGQELLVGPALGAGPLGKAGDRLAQGRGLERAGQERQLCGGVAGRRGGAGAHRCALCVVWGRSPRSEGDRLVAARAGPAEPGGTSEPAAVGAALDAELTGRAVATLVDGVLAPSPSGRIDCGLGRVLHRDATGALGVPSPENPFAAGRRAVLLATGRCEDLPAARAPSVPAGEAGRPAIVS